ncbi:hypothetical protein FACS1894109_04400 [Spirochaetia bacterium]|nr:hypothetical protein FACS1894109_04400 [Spirochaetia bacterium]
MKKFYLKCGLLALIFFSILVFLNARYVKTYAWKYQNDVEKFSHVPRNIQLANFGSSHGLLDFDWSNAPYTTFNFSLTSQRHLFDFLLLQQYSDHFAKDAVALFLIEYFEITSAVKEFPDEMPRYYRILDKQYIPDYRFTDGIRYKSFPILSAGSNVIKIFRDSTAEYTVSSQWNVSMSSKPAEWVLQDANHWYEAWITDAESDEGYQYNQKLLSEILDYCFSHNIQPVLVSTPIASALNGVYAEKSPDFFNTFYRFSAEICAEYPKVPYLDYSRDTRFSDDSLFFDTSHLNNSGTKLFTSIMIEDLEQLGLLTDQD